MGGRDMLIMCCPSKCLCSYVYVSECMYACVTESVSFVCANHTEKANSLSEWGPLSLSLSLSLSFLHSCFVQLKQGRIPLHTPTCVLLGPHCDLRWVLGAPWTPQAMCMCMCMCMCRCRYSGYVCVCVCVGVGVGVSVYVYVYVYVHSSACGQIWWPNL